MAKFKLRDKVISSDGEVKTIFGIAELDSNTVYYLTEDIGGFPYNALREGVEWTKEGYEFDTQRLVDGDYYYWGLEDTFEGPIGPQPSWRENTLTFKFI